MSEAFRHRGVIEGYYGKPWSHQDRLWVIDQLSRLGMNRYVYAPKDDPLHLARWREPYPTEQMHEFARLIAHGAERGVTVGFAMSPGRSIVYGSAEDRALLLRKFDGFRELGCRFLSLALDDVPTGLADAGDRRRFPTLGHAHVELCETLQEATGPEVTWWLVPMDYIGCEPSDYLALLGERLAPEVEIGWTGRTVVAPEIRADEAARRAETLRRKPLIWDNTPVADGPMRPMLHAGPYSGRGATLHEHASGILLNPMEQAHASLLTLMTAARYLANPLSYEPESAWQEAIERLGQGAPEALRRFALAHRFSALRPEDRDSELEPGLAELRDGIARGAPSQRALDELQERVAARLAVHEELREGLVDRKLAEELEPWLRSHRRETRRIEAALNVLRVLDSEAPRSARVFAFMGMQGRFTLEPEPDKVSYGPRRVLYPQLDSLRDDGMGFGSDPALFRDRCLADEFVELAESRALHVLGQPG